MSVEVKPYQSLFDLAIQAQGTVNAAFEMAVLNNISVTDTLTAGDSISTSVETKDVEIATFYKNKELFPATALRAEDEFNSNPTGIDYMIIETDFIVE